MKVVLNPWVPEGTVRHPMLKYSKAASPLNRTFLWPGRHPRRPKNTPRRHKSARYTLLRWFSKVAGGPLGAQDGTRGPKTAARRRQVAPRRHSRSSKKVQEEPKRVLELQIHTFAKVFALQKLLRRAP